MPALHAESGGIIQQRYEVLQKLGEGSYGIVHKARDKETDEFVAMKRIQVEQSELGIPVQLLREISVLRDLKHPNIVRCKQVIIDDSKHCVFLLLEFLEQNLAEHMHEHKETGGLSSRAIKSYMWQMLTGIEYCHVLRVQHRDLKPQNVLVGQHGNVKIADFGLACACAVPGRVMSHNVVTLWYRAPELLLGCDRYNTAVDVWSIACIFAEMIMGRALFPGKNEVDQIMHIVEVLGSPSNETWPGIESLPKAKMISGSVCLLGDDDKRQLLPLLGLSVSKKHNMPRVHVKFPIMPRFSLRDVLRGVNDTILDLLGKMLEYPYTRCTATQAKEHLYFKSV